MIKHHAHARLLWLGSALPLFWLSAAAQVVPPTALEMALDSGAGPAPGEPGSLVLQIDTREQGRRKLTDPAQRQQLFEQSMTVQRALHPDLARVLGVDAAVEQQLLTRLAEADLDRQVVVNRLGDNFVQLQAAEYDQRMLEISKLIGAERLDTYLEYQHTRKARLRVQQFNSTLPAASQLSSTQQDAVVALLAEVGPAAFSWFGAQQLRIERTPASGLSAAPSAERSRELQRRQIVRDEQDAQQLEAANRTLLQRLEPILTAEQLRAYAEGQSQQVKRLRDQARQMRTQAGFGRNEPLAVEDLPVATLTADTQLQLRVRINGIELNEILTSTDGGLVSFQGPHGLLLEAQPRLHDSGQLVISLNAYESRRNERRLVGYAETSPQITNPQEQPAYPGLGTTNRDWLLRGRMAYVLDWDATVTYL